MRTRDRAGCVFTFLGVAGGGGAGFWLHGLGLSGGAATAAGLSIAVAVIWAVLAWWNPRTERLYWREVPR